MAHARGGRSVGFDGLHRAPAMLPSAGRLGERTALHPTIFLNFAALAICAGAGGAPSGDFLKFAAAGGFCAISHCETPAQSSAPIDREFLLELGGALLGGTQPLRAQEELHQFLVTDLPGRAGDFNQLFNKARKLLARDVVMRPAEVAVAMQNSGYRLL